MPNAVDTCLTPAQEKHTRGGQLYAEGRFEEALAVLEEALRENPEARADFWNDWGAAALACGRADKAEQGFRRALALDPEDAQATANLGVLLNNFEKGLDTPITMQGDAVSLGQKQLIAFIRAVLRSPEILILDEATANIDTVTEQLLEHILKTLPGDTTRVIIAHRLNTIENADEIFFVNSGEVVRAGSLDHAVDMLLHGERES